MKEKASYERLKTLLGNIPAPGAVRTLGKMNIIREITITGDTLEVTASATGLNEQAQLWLRGVIPNVAREKAGYTDVHISLIKPEPKEMNRISYTIAVTSGKGGTGKSLISGLLAIALHQLGKEVGILDADISGHSLPNMFSLKTTPFGCETGMFPAITQTGIEIMSSKFFVTSDDDPILWPSSLLSNTFRQFFEQVIWGTLDFLIIDLPSSEPELFSTTLSSLPVDGILLVSTPGEASRISGRKVVKLVRNYGKKIIGVIENMSYISLHEREAKFFVRGNSHIEELANLAHAPILAKIPLDVSLLEKCDSGNLETYQSEILAQIGRDILEITHNSE